jgi:hypothetical protein
VGTLCGLAPGTVAKLRAKAGLAADGNGHLDAGDHLDAVEGNRGRGSPGVHNDRLDFRVGRDGKRYPVDQAAARKRILECLREDQNRSLRSVAKATGASPTTVRAVKAQLSVITAADADEAPPGNLPALPPDRRPARFLRWFERTRITDEWRDLVAEIPDGKVSNIVDEARQRARQWAAFASMLETRDDHCQAMVRRLRA